MKKIISILLVVAMTFASMLAIIPASAAPDGTAIKTAKDFANMTANGKYYLANDIVINASYAEFKGTLDGNGNTITTKGATPVFDKISGGTVKNLNISMAFEAGAPTKSFGALAAEANGTFEKINADINFTFTSANIGVSIGGLIGKINGASTVKSVVVNGAINETVEKSDSSTVGEGVAGIVGKVETGDTVTISDSINYAPLNVKKSRISSGGIVGAMTGNTKLVVNNCQNYGDIKYAVKFNNNDHLGTGGIVGHSITTQDGSASLEIKNCRNYGNLTSDGTKQNHMLGGILGRVIHTKTVKIDGCVNSGHLKSTSNENSWGAVGGILGNIETYNFTWGKSTVLDCQITNCVNTGEITGTSGAGDMGNGGILGSALQLNSPNCKVEISNCANYANVSGQNAAGIAGRNGTQGGGNKLVIKDCYNAGNATSGIVGVIAQSWFIGDGTQNKDILNAAYQVPEIINCVNEGSASNSIIGSYSGTTNDNNANPYVDIKNTVSTSGSPIPSGSGYVVVAPDDDGATIDAVKAAVGGNPADLDAVLEEYKGLVSEDYVAGWTTFEPVYTAALAAANKSTAQEILDDYIGQVMDASEALELADVTPLIPALADAIENAATISDAAGDGSAYTPDTWDTFTLALAAAEAAYDEATASGAKVKPSTVVNATKKLAQAIAGLALVPVAEKAALKANIEKYEAYDSTKYVTATWTALVEKIAEIKLVHDDVNATADDIAAAAQALQTAVNALAEKADPTDLGVKANKVIKENPKDPYTAKSYNDLRTLVNEINDKVSENDISQADIDALSAALDAAVAKLVKKGNFDAIDALLEPFEGIVVEGARPKVDEDIVETLKDKYTRDSLNAFVDVLELVAEAKKQDNIPNFTEDQAAELATALEEAIAGLVSFADYTAIDAKIAEIAELDKTKYTAESWQAVQNAINVTALLKSDRNAVQEQADAALAALEAAVAGLVEATAEEEQTEKNGCKSAIGATLVVMTATLALGATTLLKKKED